MSQNPKDYYNTTDYAKPAAAAAVSSSSNAAVHKPDEVTAPESPAGPPPPYTPAADEPPRRSTYGALGAGHDHRSYPMPSSSSSNRHEVPPPRERGHANNKKPTSLGRRLKKLLNGGGHDSDDDDDEQVAPMATRRCKRWVKCVLIALVSGLVIWTYSGFGAGDGDVSGPPLVSCHGLAAVYWDELPHELPIEKNIAVSVDGRVDGGRVTVHRTQQRGKSGLVQSKVRVAPADAVATLSYTFSPGREAQLAMRLPQREHGGDTCVELDMDLWLPENVDTVRVAVPNVQVLVQDPLEGMDLLDITGANAAVRMQAAFEGKVLRLATANADIELAQTVETRNAVELSTSNGAITAHRATSKHTIEMRIKGSGGIIAQELSADDSVRLHAANAEIRVDEAVNAANVVVENANGAISLASVGGDAETLDARTSNAFIDIAQAQTEKDAKLNLQTSNAPISIHVTRDYEGPFLVSTSAFDNAQVDDAQHKLNFEVDKPGMKKGWRIDRDGGNLVATTSNADAQVFFDV